MFFNRIMWVGVLLVTAVVLGLPAPVAAQGVRLYLPLVIGGSGNVEKPEPKINDFAAQVVQLVNEERAKVGCQPLRVDPKLTAAAYGHSQDMALNDYFSHTGLDGSSPGDRIIAEDYSWKSWGENIAAGQSTPEAAVDRWMKSTTGHREAIQNCSFQETGVGYYYLANDGGSADYYHYWTQVFASPQ